MSQRPTGPLTNLAILASAGTGKTHALAHRYIGLLGRGVDADRICALTFSRKAATEIFDSIVATLVKATRSPLAARTTGLQAGLEGMTQLEAIRLLRNLVSRLHRVQIGTLDSFIVSVLRAFSAELGVPSDFTLLDSGSVEARQLTWPPPAPTRSTGKPSSTRSRRQPTGARKRDSATPSSPRSSRAWASTAAIPTRPSGERRS
jgi:ATP-dependent exoDNAse (exonuclease V) beta subunit